MRIFKILCVLVYLSFSFDSYSQGRDSDEDTLISLYLSVVDHETRGFISNAEVLIFDGNDTIVKYTDSEGQIIHKLNTNLIYHVTINTEYWLPFVDEFTTVGIVSKTNIVKNVSVGMGCRYGLFFLYETNKLLPVDIRKLSNYVDFILLHANVSIRLLSKSNENKVLTNSRLKYIKKYFVDKGINKNRIGNSIMFQDSLIDYSQIKIEFSDSYYSLKPYNSTLSKYIKFVDSLIVNNSLEKFDLPNMSSCSGSLTGYYFKNDLVYMSSRYGIENGYSEKEMYIKDSVVYKLRYREHYAKEDMFYNKFENISELDYSKMSYSDTLYTFVLYNEPKMYKTSGPKYIKSVYDYDLQNKLLNCTVSMMKELKEERMYGFK